MEGVEILKDKFTAEEKMLLINLIGNEQIHMTTKNSGAYKCHKYKRLERLKVKIKKLI